MASGTRHLGWVGGAMIQVDFRRMPLRVALGA